MTTTAFYTLPSPPGSYKLIIHCDRNLLSYQHWQISLYLALSLHPPLVTAAPLYHQHFIIYLYVGLLYLTITVYLITTYSTCIHNCSSISLPAAPRTKDQILVTTTHLLLHELHQYKLWSSLRPFIFHNHFTTSLLNGAVVLLVHTLALLLLQLWFRFRSAM